MVLLIADLVFNFISSLEMNDKGKRFTPRKFRGIFAIAILIVLSTRFAINWLLVCEYSDNVFLDSSSRTLEFTAHVDDFLVFHRSEIHKILTSYECAFFEQI